MTPNQLIALVESHGGVAVTAEKTGYNASYLSRMMHGKDPITTDFIWQMKKRFPGDFKTGPVICPTCKHVVVD